MIQYIYTPIKHNRLKRLDFEKSCTETKKYGLFEMLNIVTYITEPPLKTTDKGRHSCIPK